MELNVGDAIDLLGNQEMPVRQNGLLQALRAIAQLLLRLTGASALIVFAYYAHAMISDMRESSYKKAVRRKYGIPDDDNDPFNVAYAKVRSRQNRVTIEDDDESSSGRSTSIGKGKSPAGREGAGVSIPHRRVVPLQGHTNDVESPDSTTSTIASQSNATSGKTKRPQAAALSRAATPQAKPEVAARDFARTSVKQKRPAEEQDVNDTNERDDTVLAASSSRKSAAKTDGNENATAGPSRGSKRQAASDEDISVNGTIGKKAGKRARRQSKKVEEVIVLDENEEQMDVDHVSRGKKRDRTEAESSFGGDEDLTGSRGRKSRRHKRKSGGSADEDTATPRRGTKRSFEGESTLGSDDGSKSPRKRGKHAPKDSHDVSATESTSDASCAGRSIGEQWNANGVTYKVGANGQRLRQVLLRKRASRYSMPQDSHHPDSRARLEILVETWLDDEDYKTAEKRGEVYEPTKKTKKTEDSSPTLEPGKQLLWGRSPNSSREDELAVMTPARTNGKQRVDLSGRAKRIPDLISLIDSPMGSPGLRQSRSYSKWEKQDLEAEAMARLRKKLEEEKKALAPPPKPLFQAPSSKTGAITASSITTSSSAPASFVPPSTKAKAPEVTTAPATINGFTPKLNGDAPKTTPSPAQVPAPSVAAPSLPKPPVVVVTPPQPSKAPSPAPIAIPTFGVKLAGTQPAATPSEKKQDAVPSASAAPGFSTGFATQNISAPKTQGNTTAASSNPSAKPAAFSGFSFPPMTNGTSTDKPAFSLGAHVSQGSKPAAATPGFSLGKPANQPTVPVSSAFGTPAKEASGFGMASSAFGTGTPQSWASTNGFSLAAPQSSTGTGFSKPMTEKNGSATTTIENPTFNFSAGPKPAAPASTTQTTSAAPAAAKPAVPAFTFGTQPGPANTSASNTASANAAPVSSSGTAEPKFSFGSNPQSASTPAPGFPTNTPRHSFGAPAAAPQPSTTPVATSSVPNFAFGAPSTQTAQTVTPSTPAPSAFTTSNATTGAFGNTTSAPATAGAPASTGFNTGAAKPSTPALKFGGSSIPSFNFSGSQSGTSSSPFQFGATTPAFGGAGSATTSASPFGSAVKPAGEAPKAPLAFGANNTTNSAFGATNGTTATAAQNNTSPFAFGNMSNPSGLTTQPGGATPAGGTGMFSFGAGAGSAFGAPASANAANNAAQPTSAFGTNTGAFAFGQKS